MIGCQQTNPCRRWAADRTIDCNKRWRSGAWNVGIRCSLSHLQISAALRNPTLGVGFLPIPVLCVAAWTRETQSSLSDRLRRCLHGYWKRGRPYGRGIDGSTSEWGKTCLASLDSWFGEGVVVVACGFLSSTETYRPHGCHAVLRILRTLVRAEGWAARV